MVPTLGPHGKSGHEQSSGAATVHTLVSSEIQYKSAYGDYTSDLKALGGSADQCLLVVRDVLATVLRSGGTGFALAHNHPSGDPRPSREDVAVTKKLEAAARCVGLRFLDHIVVAGHGGWSRVMEGFTPA